MPINKHKYLLKVLCGWYKFAFLWFICINKRVTESFDWMCVYSSSSCVSLAAAGLTELTDNQQSIDMEKSKSPTSGILPTHAYTHTHAPPRTHTTQHSRTCLYLILAESLHLFHCLHFESMLGCCWLLTCITAFGHFTHHMSIFTWWAWQLFKMAAHILWD